MRRIAFTICLLLPLSGCGLFVADVESELSPAELETVRNSPELRVAVAEKQFDALVDDMALYASQLPCTAVRIVRCANPSVVSIMADLAENAEQSVAVARDAARADSPITTIRIEAMREILLVLSSEIAKVGFLGAAKTAAAGGS